MTVDECEWKDWVWIEAQWRERRPFWISAAVGLVVGCLPVVPIVITGGTLQGTLMWLPPFFLYVFVATWFSPLLMAAHIAAIGYLGQWRWHARRRGLIGKSPGNSAGPSEAWRPPLS